MQRAGAFGSGLQAGSQLAQATAAYRVGGRQCLLLDLLAGGLLQQMQQSTLARGGEQDGGPGATGASGTADAVYIGFAVVGQIVVEYVGDTLHVQTTGRHVRGHDNVQQTALEAVDHLLTQLLTEVAVQRREIGRASCRERAQLASLASR